MCQLVCMLAVGAPPGSLSARHAQRVHAAMGCFVWESQAHACMRRPAPSPRSAPALPAQAPPRCLAAGRPLHGHRGAAAAAARHTGALGRRGWWQGSAAAGRGCPGRPLARPCPRSCRSGSVCGPCMRSPCLPMHGSTSTYAGGGQAHGRQAQRQVYQLLTTVLVHQVYVCASQGASSEHAC